VRFDRGKSAIKGNKDKGLSANTHTHTQTNKGNLEKVSHIITYSQRQETNYEVSSLRFIMVTFFFK